MSTDGGDAPTNVVSDRFGVAPRVGLVLGGGGAVGAAYHAGALAALEHDLGWDPRHAAVIAGTSAGSIVGALLRRGVAPTDLAAMTVGARLLNSDPELIRALTDRPTFPPLGLRHLLRLPRIPTPGAVVGLARLAAKYRAIPFGALSALLPAGREVLSPYLTFLDGNGNSPWPEEPLLVAAVRRRDLRRTIFGATPTPPKLSLAVAASCAIPGYFADVRVDHHRYIDGGIASATNADVLRGHDIDLAIVISPMTGSGTRSASQLIRELCRTTLDRELRALHRSRIPTVVIEPGPRALHHMSMNFMSEESSVEIVRAALLETGSQIAQSPELQNLYVRPRRPARATTVGPSPAQVSA
jgi:NTE family protein